MGSLSFFNEYIITIQNSCIDHALSLIHISKEMDTVIFDIGNVLIHFDWMGYLKSLKFDEETYEHVANAMFRNEDWNAGDSGLVTTEAVSYTHLVALAKKAVYGHVSIDAIAGPSEILVIADDSANPSYVAADLLSQAEHDELASAILVTTSEELADARCV